MEKRTYVKPVLSGEEFVPQNYIAACGDSGTVYKFTCDAGDKNLFRYPYAVYEGTYSGSAIKNNRGEWINHGGKYRENYHACGSTHEAPSDDEFINGFMDDERTPNVFEGTPVIIWTEGGNDTHCTTNLDMKNWETVKS